MLVNVRMVFHWRLQIIQELSFKASHLCYAYTKHILTLQPGISKNQLTEMHEANVALIVPIRLIKDYPQNHLIEILDLKTFIAKVNTILATQEVHPYFSVFADLTHMMFATLWLKYISEFCTGSDNSITKISDILCHELLSLLG